MCAPVLTHRGFEVPPMAANNRRREKMRIMPHNEREAIKRAAFRAGDTETEALGRYHRFLETLFGRCGEVEDAEIPVSFETYSQWLRDYPGWSYGYMRPTRSCWRAEYANVAPPMNAVYRSFEAGW